MADGDSFYVMTAPSPLLAITQMDCTDDNTNTTTVNGLYLYKEHNVSTVVVLGGVGEWLGIAEAVILINDYVANDELKKARSVSYQFSYNHGQYGGRGAVHRSPWKPEEEKKPNDGKVEDGEEKKLVTLSPAFTDDDNVLDLVRDDLLI